MFSYLDLWGRSAALKPKHRDPEPRTHHVKASNAALPGAFIVPDDPTQLRRFSSLGLSTYIISDLLHPAGPDRTPKVNRFKIMRPFASR